MRTAKSTEYFGLCLLITLSVAGMLRADWTYEYSDDFSVDRVPLDSYRHSTFWPKETTPLPGPHLYYLEINRGRALVFFDHKDQLAELAYCFPLGPAQASRATKGILTIDVSFPSVAEVSQARPGRLLYSTSPDGMGWSPARPLGAGHHEIPISSPQGTCYVLFAGTRVMIDNLSVYLHSGPVTIRVPQHFSTLQGAIDAAGDGDVIEVGPGTYSGPGNRDIDFQGKAITVHSAFGPENTIIDCTGPATNSLGGHRAFYFRGAEGSDSVLSGFTIRGGRAFGSEIPRDTARWPSGPSHPIGGGIYCEFSSPTIANCIIRDCGAELGGGIGGVGAAPMIVDCIIEECVAGGFGPAESGGLGGAVGLIEQSGAVITNCVIRNNSGYYNSQGAALYFRESTAVVAGCTISGNSAPGSIQGGGAYCAGATTDVTFRNCVIVQNQAETGAGLFAEQGPDTTWPPQPCRLSVVNCTVADNGLSGAARASSAGGIHSVGCDLLVTSSIVWYNDGTPLVIVDAGSYSPVTYSNIERGHTGPGNLNTDPLFAAVYSADYHLKSQYGRYDPRSDRWVVDSVHSPCIDTGDPTALVGEEPMPNGGRVNMGAYGATRQASNGPDHAIFHVDASTGRNWNNGASRARAFATIQKAIDAAGNGDTVLVWPGVYEEEITFDRKTITVQSAADAAVLRARDYAVSFFGGESTQSVLANFVITACGEGAIFCDGASPTLKNLTIVGNRFGVVAYHGADPNIINCILWGNGDGDLYQCTARYSDIQSKMPDKRAGNIRVDPLFADPEEGDYHLKSRSGRYVPDEDLWRVDTVSSPCIDAGDPEEDPRGERMPNGARINMGAHGGTPFASLSG